MDDDPFQPGTLEVQLAEQSTVLMAGGPFSNKRGNAYLTNDRLFFTDQRFNASLAMGVGGVLAGSLAE